jgi:hypothetical protein
MNDVEKMDDVCWLCGHLLSRHPRPKRMAKIGDWDFHKTTCYALTCQCPLSRQGQLLNDKGIPVSQPERRVV